MKNRFLIFLLVVLSLTLIIASFTYYAEKMEEGESNVPNPAAVYCVGLGYEYKIVDTEEGQIGYCVFNSNECPAWSFFKGKLWPKL